MYVVIGTATNITATIDESLVFALKSELDSVAASKVEKVSGKGLSTNDYTTADKDKLAGIAAEANKYVHPSSHPASIIEQNSSNRFVTDAEKTAWNGKANLVTTPQQTTADITYYVRTDGSDSNNGLANTAVGAFKTIQKAVNMVPVQIGHVVIINIAAGTYPENVVIQDFHGRGITLLAADTAIGKTNVSSITITACHGRYAVSGITGTSTTAIAFRATYTREAIFDGCFVTAVAPSFNGIEYIFSSGRVLGGTISNRGYAISATYSSQIMIDGTNGSNNVYGVFSYQASYVGLMGSVYPSGTSMQVAAGGGTITNSSGVLNPWGDNTWATRSFVRAYQGTAQTLSAALSTRVNFQVELSDTLSEYNPTLSRYVAQKSGMYLIKSTIGVGNMGANNRVVLTCNVNGLENNRLYDGVVPVGNVSSTIGGLDITYLNAGDIVEIYAYSAAGMTLDALSINTVFEVRAV